MTPARARAGGVAALVTVLALSLPGCGEDEDLPTPASDPVDTSATWTPTTTSTPVTTTDDSGGIIVPDEGHEGGGPDPGANEGGVNAVPGDDSGGENERPDNAGGSGSGSGGQSAPEQFDEFCEQNPAACE